MAGDTHVKDIAFKLAYIHRCSGHVRKLSCYTILSTPSALCSRPACAALTNPSRPSADPAVRPPPPSHGVMIVAPRLQSHARRRRRPSPRPLPKKQRSETRQLDPRARTDDGPVKRSEIGAACLIFLSLFDSFVCARVRCIIDARSVAHSPSFPPLQHNNGRTDQARIRSEKGRGRAGVCHLCDRRLSDKGGHRAPDARHGGRRRRYHRVGYSVQ